MHRAYAIPWYRWLRSVGMPTDHIAILLDLDPLEVDSLSANPWRWRGETCIPVDYGGKPVRYRPIRSHTATYVHRLTELGYGIDRIARILVLRQQAIADFLRRTAPTANGPRRKPRTHSEQRRVEANERRRERRRAKAAKAAAELSGRIIRAARYDDAGCEPPAPPAAELVDHQAAELAEPAVHAVPSQSNAWVGSSSIHADRERKPAVEKPRQRLARSYPTAVEVRPHGAIRWDVPLRRTADGRAFTVLVECHGCGNERWVATSFITARSLTYTAGCMSCFTPRACVGERNGRSKVTWELAREIRRLHAEGMSGYALARQCQLNAGTVRSIIREETWREVDCADGTPEPEPPPVESPPAVAPAAPKPEVRSHEWRSSPDEPRMFARGSGSHYDDVALPLPSPAGKGVPQNEHVPQKGGYPHTRDLPCK
jgi:hypothetical protein